MLTIMWIGIAAFLIFHLQKRIYHRWWNHNLFVSVEFKESSLFEGDEGKLLEIIENRKRLPLPMLRVKFRTDRNLVFPDTKQTRVTDRYYRNDVFYVGGGERITRTLGFTGTSRGYYTINGIDIITEDLFLSTTMTGNQETDKYLYVYPRPFRSEQLRLSMQMLSGEILTRQHLLEDPFEFRGIRPYQPGDELRNVNWKATARTRELKVNQKNFTSLKTVRVFFNCEDTGIRKKTQAVETSLRIVAGLCEHFLIQGMRVACYGNGTDIINAQPVQIEAGSGSNQMEQIYKALARIDLKQPAVNFGQQFSRKLFTDDKGVMTFFVAPNAYSDFTGLITQYIATGADFTWYLPGVKEEIPELPGEIEKHTQVVFI